MNADVKSAREVSDIIAIVRREQCRTRLLIYLDHVYPKRVARSVLWAALSKSDSDLSLREVQSEVEYLIEKQLITSKREKRLRISARGRDFLDGHIEEVGLADPAIFR